MAGVSSQISSLTVKVDTKPRIYTYKVTFEEVPDWYWGSHKEDKFDDGYLGSPSTHAWKWVFYTPHLQILEVFPYTDEGWEKAREVEDRCIRPDLNNPLCLNEHVGGFMSLAICRMAGSKGGKKGAETVNAEKDDLGRCVNGVKAAEKLHENKDDLGRSVHGVKSAERMHAEKDEFGRSIHSVKNAEKTNTQKWIDPCHPDLGTQNSGNLVRMQQRRGYPYGKENRVKIG